MPASRREKELSPALHAGVLALLCLGVTLLTRWPLGLHLGALPTDPNAPLHALSAQQLAAGGPLSTLQALGFPQGLPVRMIAFPVLLLAVPLNWALAPMAALNLAITLGVALQGFALGLLGRTLGWGPRGQITAAVAAISAPMVVHVQSIGQPENLGFLGMAVVCWAALGEGRRVFIGGTVGLLLAGFSSPYQALPAALLFLALGTRGRRRPSVSTLGACALSAALVGLYFLGAAEGLAGQVQATTSPPESGSLASAGVLELLVPRAMWFGSAADLPGAGERLAALGSPLLFAEGLPMAWSMAHQSSYLGLLLLVFGLYGLRSMTDRPLARALALAGGLSLVLALGPELRWWSERPGSVPLPWAVLALLPGAEHLEATHRFLSGTVFVLVLGIGWGAERWAGSRCLGLGVLLLAEGLLVAPVAWPLGAVRFDSAALLEGVGEGPVALWPGLGSLPPQDFELAALILERPVALYMGEASGLSAADWSETVAQAGVGTVLRFRDAPGGDIEEAWRGALDSGRIQLGEESCLQRLCWRDLETRRMP